MKTFTILAISALATATATSVASAVPEVPQAQAQAALQPGAMVRAADGSELGRLEGRRANDGVAEIVVRGPDGQLRGIPAAAVRIDGEELRAAWSTDQFRAAPALVAAAVGAPATGAGGNLGADEASRNTSGDPTARPSEEELGQDATRPAPAQQNQVNPHPEPHR